MMNSNLTLSRKDDVAVVTFDATLSKVNTLSTAMGVELDEAFKAITLDDDIKSIVFISGKSDNFIAGADINEFLSFRTPQEAKASVKNAQELLNSLAASQKPIVCAINGGCLGAGLEIALACQYRIATDGENTKFGLPEVNLGLLPAAGGTQRLPRLIGLTAALPMILTGRNVRPSEALKLGLIDHITTQDGLLDVACTAAIKLANGSLQLEREKKSSPMDALLASKPAEWLIFRKARAAVEKKTRGNYPAPLAIIDAVERGLRQGLPAGLDLEAKLFAQLSQSLPAKNLIRLFFMQNSHKKNIDYKTELKATNIGILGAGFMGSGIALVSIQSGHGVILNDVSALALGRAEKFINKVLTSKVKRKKSSEFDKAQTLARLSLATGTHHFQHCDLVIEAVYEDLAIKQQVLAQIEPHLNERCVIASNTSALSISEIAQNSKRKDRIIGMHYFSPVHKMPLLEVIKTKESSNDTLGLAINVGLKQGKVIIVVQDRPGFYTSRILAPFLDEATSLVLEGISPHEIDQYMENFGFPVGPITLLDEVGIDVAAHVAKQLTPHFGSRLASADPNAMAEMMQKNMLGRKSEKGFYLYDKKSSPFAALKSWVGARKPVNQQMIGIFNKYHRKSVLRSITARDIQLRIALRMINEAVLCLQEEVLSSPEDGDIGAVFGLGFPPFLGGPFRYIDTEGPSKIVGNLKRFADHFGPHFEPAPLLVDMAKHKKTFY